MIILRKIIFALVLSFTIALLFYVITYNVAYYISPPEFLDNETGRIYRVMPIGQVAIALLFAGISFIVSFILLYKKYSVILKKIGRKDT